MYDVAIIGSGPAGMSAAMNLNLHNKNIIWFGSKDLSLKVEKAEKIANYPGVPMVSGLKLNEIYKQQIEEAGLVITDKMVTNIADMGETYMLLAENDVYEAKTVLMTTGVTGAKAIPGEDDLLGKGVSYCATCDGFLYKGKTIAVLCSDKRYEHEVEYLAELADKVYLVTQYADCGVEQPNVEKLQGPITKVLGTGNVTGVEAGGRSVEVDGVFMLRSSVTPTTLLKGLEMNGPHIVVNRNMETNKKGCFAAGDCTGIPYQITKATGEGNIAAHSILRYLV